MGPALALAGMSPVLTKLCCCLVGGGKEDQKMVKERNERKEQKTGMQWDHLFSTLQDVVGVGNDSRHLLLLHQQGLCQLPVDVIKDKPLPPKVVNAGAQHLIVTCCYGCASYQHGVCAVRHVSNLIPGCVACGCVACKYSLEWKNYAISYLIARLGLIVLVVHLLQPVLQYADLLLSLQLYHSVESQEWGAASPVCPRRSAGCVGALTLACVDCLLLVCNVCLPIV